MNALFQITFRGHDQRDEDKKGITFDLKVGKTQETITVFMNSDDEIFETGQLLASSAFEKLAHLIDDLGEVTAHLFRRYSNPAESIVLEELEDVLSNYDI